MRCSWCGQFVPAETPAWTFLNWYGQPVTQRHCPDCRISCRHLIVANLLHRRGPLGSTVAAG